MNEQNIIEREFLLNIATQMDTGAHDYTGNISLGKYEITENEIDEVLGLMKVLLRDFRKMGEE